jgi:hypothetical protein
MARDDHLTISLDEKNNVQEGLLAALRPMFERYWVKTRNKR